MQNPSYDGASPDRQRLFELCSRNLDGDLTPDETAELQQLRERDRADAERFELESRRIGRLMRQLSGAPAPAALAEAVREQIEQPEPTSAETTAAGGRRRRWLISCLSASSIAACLLLVAVLNRERDAVRVAGTAAFDTASDLESMPPAAVGSAAAPMVPNEADMSESAASPDSAVVLTAGRDWQVVVVRIQGNDRNAAISQVSEFAVRNGLDLRLDDPVNEDQSKENYGFILTRAPASAGPLVDGLMNSGLARSSEWNPRRIAEMDRDELISQIAQSMLSPTASELHFGRVFLAVPRSEETGAVTATAQTEPDSDAPGEPASAAPTLQPSGAAPAPTDAADDDAGSRARERREASDAAAAARTASGQSAATEQHHSSPSESHLPDEAGRPTSSEFVLIVFEFTPDDVPGDCAPGAVPL